MNGFLRSFQRFDRAVLGTALMVVNLTTLGLTANEAVKYRDVAKKPEAYATASLAGMSAGTLGLALYMMSKKKTDD